MYVIGPHRSTSCAKTALGFLAASANQKGVEGRVQVRGDRPQGAPRTLHLHLQVVRGHDEVPCLWRSMMAESRLQKKEPLDHVNIASHGPHQRRQVREGSHDLCVLHLGARAQDTLDDHEDGRQYSRGDNGLVRVERQAAQ